MNVAIAFYRGSQTKPGSCTSLKEMNTSTEETPEGAIRRMVGGIRELALCLEPLPEKVYFQARLYYHDHTPDDYEPEEFKSSTLPDLALPDGTTSIEAGEIRTGFHLVRVVVGGIQEETTSCISESR